MTAQIPETVILDGCPHDLCAVKGDRRLFDPRDHGVTPIPLTSDCRRGFMSTYLLVDGMLYLDEIEIGLDPRDPTGRDDRRLAETFGDLNLNGSAEPGHYGNLEYPIAFTGTMLLGCRPIDGPFVRMGFHPAFAYRQVVEIELEDGRVVSRVDRSAEFDEVRRKLTPDDWVCA